MKQVFPSIRPRRLGTRGNSRYCYAALRKTTQLAPPSLPELKLNPESADDADEDNVTTFVKTTIKAWASNLLSTKFERLEDLADYITTNNMNSLSAKVLQRKITRDARLSHKKNVSFARAFRHEQILKRVANCFRIYRKHFPRSVVDENVASLHNRRQRNRLPHPPRPAAAWKV